MQPHIRKHLLKLVYSDEWATSLKESHPEGPARDEVIQKHNKEVEVIRRALAPYQAAVQKLTSSMLTDSADPFKIAWF
jgi:hypothetical protein